MNDTTSREKGGQGAGDFADRPMPLDQRMPRGNLMMAWWAVCSAIFYMVVAAAMARSYGTTNALIGIALTVVCYGVINAVISRYAIRTGLTVALFSRVLFGHLGAMIATLIFFATALYYAVFEGYVMALVLSEWSPSLGMASATLIVVVVGVSLIFGSVQHWLDKFNGVLLPVYIVGMLIAVGMAMAEFGYPSGWLSRVPEGGASPFGWLSTFAYYMGVWVLMMFTFDYARFGRVEDSRFHARVTFGIPFYLMTFVFSGVVGILLDACLPTDGLSEASIVLGLLELMGLGGLALVWVTQSRINTANFYLATVNLEAFVGKLTGLKLNKILAGCLVGGLAYLLMRADVFSYLLAALAYQGVFVVAWVGVALAHILSPEGRLEVDLDADISAFNPVGLAAWALAAIVGIALMLSPSLAGASAPLTFVVAWGIHVLGRGLARHGATAA
ncbi:MULTISPECIES: allantoin permease [unclassified Halomonas]|uniref:purine-cytosine permease family protein n=1 Tax=unclassified Halomonas TaxID=2609666 RepID=UPI000C920CC8|nr:MULTISPECIES: allantoin permease [unclassified Halomonas]MAR71850.1 allantoin permease [Halomonas sp.]|tara:strand:- start:789 stop:2123 length:1335 start_codon:yes stop_codon:yes gene_type:complete